MDIIKFVKWFQKVLYILYDLFRFQIYVHYKLWYKLSRSKQNWNLIIICFLLSEIFIQMKNNVEEWKNCISKKYNKIYYMNYIFHFMSLVYIII